MDQPDDGPGLVHEDEDVAFVIGITPHLCLHYVEQSQTAASEVHLACVKIEPQFLAQPKHSAGLILFNISSKVSRPIDSLSSLSPLSKLILTERTLTAVDNDGGLTATISTMAGKLLESGPADCLRAEYPIRLRQLI